MIYTHFQVLFSIFNHKEKSHKIEKLSFADNSIKTIYTNTIDLPYTSFHLANADEQYLYLEYIGYENEDGTSSSKVTTINKDGSDEQLLFKHKGI